MSELRKFYELSDKNTLDCNLTELNASEAEDKGYQTHNDWMAHNDRYAYVWKQLTTSGGKKLKEAKTLLDVGCGRLQLPHFFWRNRYSPPEDFQYWGLELRATEKWLDLVGWKRQLNLVKCDLVLDNLSEIEAFPGQFDVVVCFETFEHVPREQGPVLMRRLYDWVKPGGTVFFSTPNAGVSESTADNHIGPDGVSREWTYEDKINLARDTGFNIIDTYGTFCGVTRLPAEVQERIKSDPFLQKIKKYHTHSRFTTFMSVNYPEYSNNSLFHMERPA